MCSYMYNKLKLLLYQLNDKMQIYGDHWPIWPSFMNGLFLNSDVESVKCRIRTFPAGHVIWATFATIIAISK